MKSDTSQCSQESEDLNSVLAINNLPRSSKTGKGGTGILMKENEMFALQTSPHFVALGSQRSTNTLQSCLFGDFQTSLTLETAPKSIQVNYRTLICSVEDFLVSHSQSLERGEVSKIPEVRCFLRLQEYLKLKDLKLYSLKTSKAYSITTKGKLSKSSWKRWMNWGMKLNGWYLTANFSEFPRTEKGCSLSEVLEENVDQKYYLSEKATKKLIEGILRKPQRATLSLQDTTKAEQEHISQFHLNSFPVTKKIIKEIIALQSIQLIVEELWKRGIRIRKLTPMETERLQGFPDNWTEGFSDTQRYKMMGNAVTTNVIKAIAEKL